jgi:hypothetical protein
MNQHWATVEHPTHIIQAEPRFQIKGRWRLGWDDKTHVEVWKFQWAGMGDRRWVTTLHMDCYKQINLWVADSQWAGPWRRAARGSKSLSTSMAGQLRSSQGFSWSWARHGSSQGKEHPESLCDTEVMCPMSREQMFVSSCHTHLQ